MTYADSGWWLDHFSGLLAELWESIVPPAEARRDADFLETALRLPTGARILDLPCGDGRVALELAARGYHLVGIDISAALLDKARRRSQELGLAVEWRQADMRALPGTRGFDAGFCWGDSFGYLDDRGNRDFLQAVRRELKPGAHWAMEMQMVAEVLFPRFRAEAASAAGGLEVRIRRRHDPMQGRLAVEYTVTRGPQRETKHASYRIHTCSEIFRMLAEAGFRVERLLDGSGQPFAIGCDRLRIVAVNGLRPAEEPREA